MRGVSSGEATATTPVSTALSRATLCGGPLPPRAPPPPPPAAGLPAGLPPAFPPDLPGDLPGDLLPPDLLFVSLIAVASAFDHVAGHLGDAHLGLVGIVQHAEPDLGRLLALRIDQHQVRQVDRRLFLDDAARLRHALRLGVLGGDIHPLNQGTVDTREHPQHLAAAALTGPR